MKPLICYAMVVVVPHTVFQQVQQEWCVYSCHTPKIMPQTLIHQPSGSRYGRSLLLMFAMLFFKRVCQ